MPTKDSCCQDQKSESFGLFESEFSTMNLQAPIGERETTWIHNPVLGHMLHFLKRRPQDTGLVEIAHNPQELIEVSGC